MSSAFKKSLNTTVAFATFLSLTPQEAKAACGGAATGGSGPPAISATEVSTAQALQLIRKRRDEALSGGAPAPIQVAQVTPQQPAPAAQPAPKPVAAPTSPAQAPAQPAPAAAVKPPVGATAPAAQAAPKVVAPNVATPKAITAPKPAKPTQAVVAKKPAPIVALAKPSAGKVEPIVMASRGGSLKDSYNGIFSPEPTRAAWGQLFADYERHEGWTLDGGNRGELTSKMLTSGAVAGMDWRVSGATGTSTKLLVGVLGGLTASETKFNDVTFLRAPAANNDVFSRTNARENVAGGGGGVYALLAGERLSIDGLVKVDAYDLNQSDTVQQLTGGGGGCGASVPENRKGEVDFTVFTIASNLAYRYDLGANSFFEPTFGMRYTHVSYGSQSGSLPLGFQDGDAFRLQGGARIGTVQPLADGKIWLTTLTGLLYSDVSVDGFSAVGSGGFNPATIDEGKLRVMGQISTSLVTANGYTYSLQADVRGGEDVFGVGGKLAVRYEW
jgi:Autotransporter beta-domain